MHELALGHCTTPHHCKAFSWPSFIAAYLNWIPSCLLYRLQTAADQSLNNSDTHVHVEFTSSTWFCSQAHETVILWKIEVRRSNWPRTLIYRGFSLRGCDLIVTIVLWATLGWENSEKHFITLKQIICLRSKLEFRIANKPALWVVQPFVKVKQHLMQA